MQHKLLPDSLLAKYGYSTPWNPSIDRTMLIDTVTKLKPLADSPEMDCMSIYVAAALFYLMGYNQAIHESKESPRG